MSTYETHVFLGPTLDVQTARHYLEEAHYHPPIQCGDMVRLLRLAPKRIILIDGLYEQVPAVWHKEILLAMDRGIEVYGAASMGALRAAELYPYGMIGIGSIFEDFKEGILCDDDEVAVLHQGVEHQLLPLNDAMVNIRKTLEQAYQTNIISIDIKHALIKQCKAQFYPQRSLQQALTQLSSEFKDEGARLNEWLKNHGIIDVKRQDAIVVLKYVQAAISSASEEKKSVATQEKLFEMPYTKFIASLVDDVVGTPFQSAQPWLPEIEKKLISLSAQKSADYNLIIELAGLIKNASSVLDPNSLLEDHAQYLLYIEKNELYLPKKLVQFFREHQTLSLLYPWMLHYICLGNITKQRISHYLSGAAFYFDWEIDPNAPSRLELLSWILLFVLLLHQQLNDERLTIKRTVLEEHLQEIRFWARYKQHQKRGEELKTPHQLLNIKVTLDFVMIYMKVIYIHQGVKDFKSGLTEVQSYFHWIYDAIMLYEKTVS